MSPKALIRHHSGRMAGPARWYLAGLGVMALLLLTAHFSVQEHVQKTLRLAVHDWMQSHGGEVQHVRYRLLRGALTLEGVRWSDGADAGMRLNVSRVFVRTSSRAMLSSAPSFSLLRFEHPVLRVQRGALLEWLRGDAVSPLNFFSGLLPHAEAVAVEDMALMIRQPLHEQYHDSPGERRDTILLRQLAGAFSAGGVRLDGMLGDGQLRLDARVGSGGGLSGTLALSDAEVDGLEKLSGSPAFEPGLLASGNLVLRGDWGKRDIGVLGKLRLRDETGSGSLGVQGGWSESGADIDLVCEGLALPTLPLGWPDVAGRTLTTGRFSGVMRLQRSWHNGGQGGVRKESGDAGWRIGLDGSLHGAQLASETLPAWDIARLDVRQGVLLSSSGAFSAGELRLEDADIRLNAYGDPSASAALPSPRIERLSLTRIRPQLHFADTSSIALPDMQGKGRMHPGSGEQGGRIVFTSMDRVAVVAADKKVRSEQTDSRPSESWKIVAEGDPFGQWQARLSASHVPLVRLRPLLPLASLPGEMGVPEYSGLADISLNLVPEGGGMQASGKASVFDMQMMQGGDQLSASRVDVDIALADSDGTRQLARVALSDWQYQMALRPLPRMMSPVPAAGDGGNVAQAPNEAGAQDQTEADAPDVVGVIESTAPMRDYDWQIGELVAQSGSISLGQPDALIAGQLLLRVHHLKNGELAPFTLSGELGGGVLQAGGKLQWQPAMQMEVKGTLAHALPFMFNDWLRLSGMPRLVRGRLDASFDIARQGPVLTGGYAGQLKLSLHQGVPESGVFPEDPMLQRSGYTTQGLLERLNHPRGFKLVIPFTGSWSSDALVDVIGEAGLEALKAAAGRSQVSPAGAEPPISKLVRIRLQGKRGFSHNERVRLRTMIRTLLADQTLIVELTPQLGKAQPDADMTDRVLRTQQAVERYMNRMGVASRRIFPVWPQAQHRHGDAPGLLLRARAP